MINLQFLRPKSLEPVVKQIIRGYNGTLFAPSPKTCFSDSAGSTPAVIDGVVGCMIDASSFVGPELVGDPGFDNTGWWGLTQPAVGSATISGGALNITCTSGYADAFRNNLLTIGKAYKVTINITSLTGSIRLWVGGYSDVITSAGIYTTYLKATGDTTLAIARWGIPSIFVIDSISVKEVGIIATQATSGFKPILRKGTVNAGVSNGVGNYWLDFDGVDDFLQLSAAPFQFADNQFVSVAAQQTHGSGAIISPATETTNYAKNICLFNRGVARWTSDVPADYDAGGNSGSNLMRVYTGIKSGVSGISRINGAQYLSTANLSAATISTKTKGFIGHQGNDFGRFGGKVSGIAITSVAHNAAELRIIERYLASLGGVTI